MKFLPVVVRELRAEARNPYNYWLRVLTGALAVFIFFTVALMPFTTARELGVRLFRGLNGLMFFSICLLTPILTSDCLSREKREGTLSLLFLTPLTALGVVAAKSIIHGIRSMSLVLVAVPVSAAAMLWGGLNWREFLVAALLNFDALVLGLAAGVLASAGSRIWSRAVVLGLMLGFASTLVFAEFFVFIFFWSESGSLLAALHGLGTDTVLAFCSGVTGFGFTTRQLDSLLFQLGCLSPLVALVAVLGLRTAARKIGQAWQDESLSPRQVWYRRVFCTPRFWRGMFARRMSESLDRNPIGWLQHYSWSARAVKWGWCGLFILIEGGRGLEYSYSFFEWQAFLLGLLLLGMSLSAAGSFMQERRGGAMELILVSPLSVEQVIFGRWRGICAQFVPTAAVMLLYMVLAALTYERPEFVFGLVFGMPAWIILILGPLFVVPFTGLYFSLRQRNFMGAWLLTVGVSLAAPLLCAVLISGLFAGDEPARYYGGPYSYSGYYGSYASGSWYSSGLGFRLFMFLGVQSILAAVMYRRLKKTLTERTFAVNLS